MTTNQKGLYADDPDFGSIWSTLQSKQYLDDYLDGFLFNSPLYSALEKLIRELHAGALSGHVGRNKTIARSLILLAAIKEECQSDICQRQVRNTGLYLPLSIPTASIPGALDFILGLPRSQKGNDSVG